MSKLLVRLGLISLLAPLSLDLYLPSLPAIAADLHAGAGSVQLALRILVPVDSVIGVPGSGLPGPSAATPSVS